MRRAVAVVLLFLQACTWGAITPPSASYTGPLPKKVRVVRQDGSSVELERPRVVGDSIAGDAKIGKPKTWQYVAIPLSDVHEIQSYHVTALGVAGTIVGSVVGWCLGGVLNGNGACSAPWAASQ